MVSTIPYQVIHYKRPVTDKRIDVPEPHRSKTRQDTDPFQIKVCDSLTRRTGEDSSESTEPSDVNVRESTGYPMARCDHLV